MYFKIVYTVAMLYKKLEFYLFWYDKSKYNFLLSSNCPTGKLLRVEIIVQTEALKKYRLGFNIQLDNVCDVVQTKIIA